MSEQYDVIVIGGGVNGLVTAAVLAQARRRVLVVEQSAQLGGLASQVELWPGYRAAVGFDTANLFAEEIVRGLFLKMHGLAWRESPVAIFAPQTDGTAVTLWRDEAKTVADIAQHSPESAEKWPAFRQQVSQMAGVLRQLMLLTPPDPFALQGNELSGWGKVGLNVKRLGNRQMMELLRVLPMSASDYLGEWFKSEPLKGALAGDSVNGNQLGPVAGGTAMMFLYQQSGGFLNTRFVQGGMGQLAESLAEVIRSQGGEIRCTTAVAQILVRDNMATGVKLASGEELYGRYIASSADPRQTFFHLVGVEQLEPRFMRPVRSLIYRGVTARLHLALSGLPEFRGQTEAAQLLGQIRISPSLEYLERASDAAKYGRFSTAPYLNLTIPSLHEPSVAPNGRHLMSITMQYAPFQLRDSDWASQKEALTQTIIQTLSQYAPHLPGLIEQSHLSTPADWQAEYGLTEGHIHHGQMSLDQLLIMRPVSGWAQYRTPINNLFLCGSGAHPGGGLTGLPGWNAARELLKR